jgi:hypothetical protein
MVPGFGGTVIGPARSAVELATRAIVANTRVGKAGTDFMEILLLKIRLTERVT